MMILGIAVTATIGGRMLDPFSPARLIEVVGTVCGAAFVLSVLAIWGVERPGAAAPAVHTPFLAALRDVWAEPQARRFAVFVFVSMLAYSAQELVIEPFAGAVFRLSPGQSTGLTGQHHAGVLLGMALVAVVTVWRGGYRGAAMRAWTMGGCVASAACILVLAACGMAGPAWSLTPAVLALGAANGAFAVSAIGAMMGLASAGRDGREGTRVGLWGAAQALAFGAGGLFGTGLSDVARALIGSPAPAYAAVFVLEAALFLLAARLASGVFNGAARGAIPSGAVQAA